MTLYTIRRFKRLALYLACPVSLIMGLTAVWIFAPAAFAHLGTIELAGVLGLLVLPAATFWAVLADRRAAARIQACTDAAPRVDGAHDHEPSEGKPARDARFSAHTRAVRHPRTDRAPADQAS